MIRAAIVGLGRWGRSLVAASTDKNADKSAGKSTGKSTGLTFAVAATRNRARAEDFCRKHGIALLDGFDEVLRRDDIDAVVLATPHTQHRAQAIGALAAGKHVLVEKPLALDLAGARAIAEAALRAGRVLAVGLNRRFHPGIAELRRRARDDRLGSILAMVAQHTTSTAQFIAPDNWRSAAAEAPAGAFTAVGIHVLDHMIELGGRVRDVRATTARHYPGPSDDTTTIMLRFAGGASGLIFCSVATATNFSFTAYGTKSLAEISQPDLSRLRFAPAATAAPTGLVPAPPEEVLNFPGFAMLHAELTAFAGAIRDGVPYPVPIDEVLHGMAVLDAVVESAASGKIVSVADR